MEKRSNIFKEIRKYLVLFVATIIYSAGISLFFDANSLAPGGVTGIAIIISHLTKIQTGTLFLIFNIPILAFGAWKFGWKFIFSSIYCTGLISVFTNLWTYVKAPETDLLIAALSGGILVAIGMGLVFRNGATTGGMDIVIKFLRLKYPHLRTGTLFLIIDACVIALSGILLGDFEVAMYAAIGVFVCTTLMDVILYGKDEAKLIFIVSDKNDLISSRIMDEISSGATLLEGKGAYSHKRKEILMCVVRKQQAAKVEEIVKETDDKSFLIISSASEIFGEGYKSYLSERL